VPPPDQGLRPWLLTTVPPGRVRAPMRRDGVIDRSSGPGACPRAARRSDRSDYWILMIAYIWLASWSRVGCCGDLDLGAGTWVPEPASRLFVCAGRDRWMGESV